MSELKPCPFCGGVAQINTWTMHGITESRCFCPNSDCPNSVRTVALATWNARPIEDALNARIAELEEENDRLQDGWFRDETICPDGSLRPKVSDLLNRIAELEEAQRWIPVSERLPEEFTPVLTFSKDNDKPVTAILAAGFWWSNVDDAGCWWSNVDWTLNVTHWMSLPEPPEDNYVGDSDHEHDDRIL